MIGKHIAVRDTDELNRPWLPKPSRRKAEGTDMSNVSITMGKILSKNRDGELTSVNALFGVIRKGSARAKLLTALTEGPKSEKELIALCPKRAKFEGSQSRYFAEYGKPALLKAGLMVARGKGKYALGKLPQAAAVKKQAAAVDSAIKVGNSASARPKTKKVEAKPKAAPAKVVVKAPPAKPAAKSKAA